MHVIYRCITYVFGMFVQLQENRMEMEKGNEMYKYKDYKE